MCAVFGPGYLLYMHPFHLTCVYSLCIYIYPEHPHSDIHKLSYKHKITHFIYILYFPTQNEIIGEPPERFTTVQVPSTVSLRL